MPLEISQQAERQIKFWMMKNEKKRTPTREREPDSATSPSLNQNPSESIIFSHVTGLFFGVVSAAIYLFAMLYGAKAGHFNLMLMVTVLALLIGIPSGSFCASIVNGLPAALIYAMSSLVSFALSAAAALHFGTKSADSPLAIAVALIVSVPLALVFARLVLAGWYSKNRLRISQRHWISGFVVGALPVFLAWLTLFAFMR